MNRRLLLATLLVLGVALALRVGVALAFPNAVWPDEIFQTQEQAHRLAFGHGIIPWEFREGVRSWLLPGVLGGVFRGSAWMGPGSSGYLTAGVVFLSLISLIPVAGVFAAVRERRGLGAAIVAGVLVATWWELVYFAPKALNEVVAAHVLCAAIFLIRPGVTPTVRRLAAAGALTALAVGLRVHLAPAALLLTLVALHRWRRRGGAFVGGAALVVLALGALDWATWGRPFASYIASVQLNLFEGKSHEWGVAPWWSYLRVLGDTWGPVAPLVVILALAGMRRDKLPLLVGILILGAHMAIGHKEYRFLVPALVLFFYSAGLGAGEAAAWLQERIPRASAAVVTLAVLGWCAASTWRGAEIDTSRTTLSIQMTPFGWQLANARAGLVVTAAVGRMEPLCGVGFVAIPWWITGGYTYLHRDVPWIELRNVDEVEAERETFDVAVAYAGARLPMGWQPVVCRDGMCAWRRAGPPGCRKGRDIRAVTH